MLVCVYRFKYLLSLQNAEHREMLNDEAIIYHVIRRCCGIPQSVRETMEVGGIGLGDTDK